MPIPNFDIDKVIKRQRSDGRKRAALCRRRAWVKTAMGDL